MIKTLITEIDRAREIMGLKPKIDTLLNEQLSKEFSEYLSKIFGKNISKEAAEKLSNRISELLSRTSSKKIDSIFKRLAKDVNTQTIKGTQKIVADTGITFNASLLKRIMESVTSGKLTGAKLDELIAKLPERLADGSSFRASLGAELKALEKKVAKETSEKSKVKTDDVKTKTDDVKTKTDGSEVDVEIPGVGTVSITKEELGDLIAINSKGGNRVWWKDIGFRVKDFMFGKNVAGDVILLKNNALVKFLDGQGIKSIDDLIKILKDAKSQALLAGGKNNPAIKSIDPQETGELIAALLKENSKRLANKQPILEMPPGLVDEVQTLFLMSNYRKFYIPTLNTAWVRRRIKDLNATIKKGGEGVNVQALKEERDALLKEILGTNVDDVVKANFRNYSAQINKSTLGGLGRWAIRDIKNISKTLGFFTFTMAVNAIISAWINQFGGTKAIAGLTKNFYEKFRGHKWMIQTKGGLTDEQASKAAIMLKKYVRGWSMFRNLAVQSNFEDRLEKICGTQVDFDGTLMGCTEENRLRFWNETVKEDKSIADWTEGLNLDNVGALKFITGTDDTGILNVYKNYIPTILAASQVAYFYEDGEAYELLDDLDMMSSQVPILGTIENAWYGKTKGDVMKILNNTKPWVIGEGEAGSDFALAIEEITANWPEFASFRKTDSGKEYYSAYKAGAKIPPAALARITDENNYVAGSFDDKDVYKAPENFNLWLDNLTVEEFDDGFCKGIETDCEPYVVNEPSDSDKLAGYDTAKIKTEVTTVLKRLIKNFQNSNVWNSWFTSEDVKTARGEQVDVDLGIVEGSVKSKPVMEGLIRILLKDLNKK